MATERTHVLIAGGGVAGLEALMALADLAGDRVRITLMAPDPDFVLKPLRVGEPFAVDHVRRHALAEVAESFGAQYVQDALERVDCDQHSVTGASGSQYSYDRLIVAVGAHPYPAFADALTFGTERDPTALNGILADLEEGYSKSVAFVVPAGVTWPLPLYELAVMTARQVSGMAMDDVRSVFVTPETSPLAVFGENASEAVAKLLEEGGIEVVAGSEPHVERGRVGNAAGFDREVDRVVTLPLLEGPRIPGLPRTEQGFLPVGEFCRVVGAEDVFAAGDGADFPIKQGGLACQQADAIAELIASEAGADVEPRDFQPVLRGRLMTGRGTAAQFLRSDEGESRTSAQALWWPPNKVAGRYLAPWLTAKDGGSGLAREPNAGELIDVALPRDRDGLDTVMRSLGLYR